LFSDIFIKSFSAWLICWRDRSASGSADREAAQAVGWANNAAAAVAKTASLKTPRQDRAIDARLLIGIVILYPPPPTGGQ
jgi:hypothetical protein